jgi:hypothetical protein
MAGVEEAQVFTVVEASTVVEVSTVVAASKVGDSTVADSTVAVSRVAASMLEALAWVEEVCTRVFGMERGEEIPLWRGILAELEDGFQQVAAGYLQAEAGLGVERQRMQQLPMGSGTRSEVLTPRLAPCRFQIRDRWGGPRLATLPGRAMPGTAAYGTEAAGTVAPGTAASGTADGVILHLSGAGDAAAGVSVLGLPLGGGLAGAPVGALGFGVLGIGHILTGTARGGASRILINSARGNQPTYPGEDRRLRSNLIPHNSSIIAF